MERSEDMMPKVSLQLLMYNESFKVLDAVIESIVKINYPNDRLQVVLLSNAYKDHDTFSHVKNRWTSKMEGVNLVLLRNDPNTGFAGGHQNAYEAGSEWDPEYIYLLNADGHLDEDAILRSVEYMVRNPNVAIAQSRIMLEREPDLLNSCGNHMHYLGFGYSDGYRQEPASSISEDRSHFYASGAGVVMRARVLEEIGGMFDPSYFLYHEDVDISWRSRLAGYDIGYAKDSIMYHDYEFASSIRKFYWMERNRFLTHLTHLKIPTILLMLPMIAFMEIGTLAFSVKSGWFGTKIKVHTHFLKWSTWKYVTARRRLIRSIRRVDDIDMIKLMVPTIEAQEIANPLLKHVVNPILRAYYIVLLRIVRW